MAVEVTKSLSIPLRELQFSYSRSGGPGGQKVNKSNSKVTLRWSIEKSRALSDAQRKRLYSMLEYRLSECGEIVIQSDRYRDRGRNTADCVQKLTVLVKKALARPKKRIATKPSKASREKRLESKKQRSETKKGRRKINSF